MAGMTEYVSITADPDMAKKLFGFATQTPSFYEHLTVKENLLYYGTLYAIPLPIIRKNMATLLGLVHLLDVQDTIAGDLSAGMKKRLDMACALIHNPKILILDEPTTDLDIVARKQVWNLVKHINANGTTIIIASHLLDEIETLCGSIAILHDARIISQGNVAQLRQAYAQQEEVHLKTEKKDYSRYLAVLSGQSELKITGMGVQADKLVVRSKNAKETLHYLLHIADAVADNVVDIYISKPSLNDIFEWMTERQTERQKKTAGGETHV